ncbi:D-amino-acid transaminase [Kaustia mangrovi]|uniref:Probable branched-chain-amino-acid aminotransferase n=1 Tax=Kaustia mangrovi TaxID=2593653 RepID=A0A7S8HBZ3_9HYPH|nr:D-amino-acid transaminase [Kaustia mangrovi]QPC43197.1 D-amino-acid transaminase [Kaustia mangrovi]
MSRIVHVNGSFVPEEEARVSPFDRGYLFADGVYEVTAVIDGKLVDYAPHMERLDRSLGELQMDWPCTKDELREVHEELVRQNGIEEGVVYMQVTRGVAEREFSFPENTPTTLFAFTQEKALIDNPKAETGVEIVSVPEIRWQRRDIKSIALLAQCLGKQQAKEAGAYEAWMVEDGMVTEGTSSSAYIVKDGVVITRPLSNSILPGVTRRTLLALAAERQIRIEERLFSIDEAYKADEAFMTSASSFVLPIVEIDGRKVGAGAPGEITTALRRLYLESARSAG